MFITILIAILVLGYTGYIVFEKIYHSRIRKSFKYVIHVNGTRGKSTTTRLIDAGFRNVGFKVFSKTTGTLPTMINTSNQDVRIKRLAPANIREQLKILRLAYKEKADVVVLECMAVNPELQKISEKHILKADVLVITNVREDHLNEMGETLDDIAFAFCNTIPEGGIVVTTNSKYNNLFKKETTKKNTTLHICEEYLEEETLDTFKENIALALGVCKALNLDETKFFEGMKNYHHDIGAYEKIKLNETIFLNGLSINDPTSIKMTYDQIIKEYDPNEITILLNSRIDRPTRVKQHIKLIQDLNIKKLILIGSNKEYIARCLKKEIPNIYIEFLKKYEDLKSEKIVFAIGNIAGKGMEVLEYFRMNGEKLW